MKLYSITMINSGNFSFAHLTLDANSIQLSGRNNKGKTSLLWTLPLLFVVDRKQATHPNYTPKESLNFYFNNPERSYIIFEGYDEKQGYFYMLLRRDGVSIRYYFVKKKFDQSMFVDYDDMTQTYTVFPFSRILENPATGIGAPLKDHREVLAKAITSKKGEVAFLRLSKDSKSRQFSDLYKHLFRSSSDSEILKNGILIVNGLKDETLNMRNELPPSLLAEWKREQDEINTLKEVQQYLVELKEKRNNMEERRTTLIYDLIMFEEIDFNQVRQSVNSEYDRYQEQIKELDQQMRDLERERGDVRKRISACDEKKGAIITQINQKQQKIEAIEGYDNKVWLEQSLHNKEKESSRLQELIESVNTAASIEEIDRKLSRLNLKKNEIKQFVNNNEDTLLMNLSTSKKELVIMHTVLSNAVTSLPKSAILSGTTESQDNVFSYNGAKIDISSLKIKEIPTVEERKIELREIEQEIEKILAVKENFNKKKNLESKKKTLDSEIHTIRSQLSDLSNLDNYRRELSLLKKELLELLEKRQYEEDNEESIKSKQKQITEQIEEVKRKESSLSSKEETIGEFFNNYLEYCRDAEFSPSPGKVLPIYMLSAMIQEKKDVIDNKYNAFKTEYEVYRSAEQTIERHTSKINLYDDSTSESSALKDNLLSLLERKCEHIDIRAKELQDKVITSTNLFMAKVKRFLEQMENVKKFTSRINNMLSKYTISDLSGIHIRFIPNEYQIGELEQLSSDNVSLFYQSNYDIVDQDETILRYIRTEKNIPLSNLFEIVVERTKKDSDNKRDKHAKSKQSNGTERMLHVMLLLILLRELIHPDDTIPFLIDEVMDIDDVNQDELLKFFDELNLLPISASPHVAHTFEKIYHIEEESSGRSYINDNTSTRKEKKEEA